MSKRAKRGGEVAPNGEHYKGGQFINTIPENAKRGTSGRKKTGKREVGPYQWEMQPTPHHRPIYRLLAGTFGYVDRAGVMQLNTHNPELFERMCESYNRPAAEVAEMAAAWNRGERWIVSIPDLIPAG